MRNNDSKFVFVGNHIAIDFINTQVIQNGDHVDLLIDEASVVRWAQEGDRCFDGKLKADELSTVKALRTSLREIVQTKIEEHSVTQESLANVNRHLADHAPHKLLQFNDDNGEFELLPDKRAGSLQALLAELAYEGAQLLTSNQAPYIKSCSNPECVLLFLDTSRTRKRRWCSMEICGNRAKAAKYYQKQAR
jgi:predicted RNA-binding Zn ribbon-like protein